MADFKGALSNIAGAFTDPQFYKDLGGGTYDAGLGAVSGALGAPGDLESFIRMLPYLDESKTYLPTSEDIQKYLPMRDESVRNPYATTGGTLLGGFYNGPLSGMRIAASIPKAIHHGAKEFAEASFRGAPAIVKPKGGNWLGGLDAVRDSLQSILPENYQNLKRAVEKLAPDDDYAKEGYAYGNHETGDLYRPGELEPTLFLGDWMNNTLAKYMMTDMGTEADPIRALAERGISHGGRWRNDEDMARSFRDDAGYPRHGSAVSPMAKNWEDASDSAIYPRKAGLYTREVTPGDKAAMKENPWLSKLDPEQSVYELNSPPRELGLDHLYDELWNAVRPDSDLPPELRLRPESLQRMGVPQAVERVDAINKYRAQQMEKAQLEKQNNPAVQLHKEYPEGYRWVQLKPPADVKMDPGQAYFGMNKDQYQQLQDALKYEGDTMGHCVGGYCDDVAGGKSSIYSLRDAKGNPHVTIETRPAGKRQSIIQIKGKQNRAPKQDYLPFVQDFVRSGKWKTVDDLDNAGLMTHKDAFSHLWADSPDRANRFADATPKGTGYFSEKDLEGYARGGHVEYDDAAVGERANNLLNELGLGE